MKALFILVNVAMLGFGVHELSPLSDEAISYIIVISPTLNLYIVFRRLAETAYNHIIETYRISVEIKTIEQEIAIKELSNNKQE
jgi:hypothetical protein